MIKCDLSKIFFVSNLHNKKCVEFSLTYFGTLKYDCVIKISEMLNFLPLINSYVTIGLSFFVINHISNHIIKKKKINTLCLFPGLYSSIFL